MKPTLPVEVTLTLTRDECFALLMLMDAADDQTHTIAVIREKIKRAAERPLMPLLQMPRDGACY